MPKIPSFSLNKHNWRSFIIFTLIFCLIFILSGLNRDLNNELISGYHYWRKSDTYAQVLNYYNNGLNFFDFSLYFNQMTSQAKAVGEFPLFYYLVAIQKTIFGDHIFIAKINWIMVSYFGVYSLFKIAQHYTKHNILSYIVAFSLFLTPIYTVYLIEFLPDPIAFHFVLIGLYFLLKHFKNQRNLFLFIGIFFISWAGMIKPFFLIPFISFLCVHYYILIKNKSFTFKQTILLIPFVFIGVWFYFMNWYNSHVDCDCFLSSITPIWQLNTEEIYATVNQVVINWLPAYIPFESGIILLIITLFVLFYKTSFFKRNFAFLILLILGSICYILLFTQMFNNHDYYIWPVLYFTPLILLLFFQKINHLNWLRKSTTTTIGILLLALLLIRINFNSEIRTYRKNDPTISPNLHYQSYLNLDAFLTKHGILIDTFIIAFSDKSPNYALSLMDRKGWSGYQTDYAKYTIPMLKDLGANYLILNDKNISHQDSLLLNNVKMELIADTNHLLLYHLYD